MFAGSNTSGACVYTKRSFHGVEDGSGLCAGSISASVFIVSRPFPLLGCARSASQSATCDGERARGDEAVRRADRAGAA